jgi:hypothetical protein
VLWLSEDPASGTIPARLASEVQLTIGDPSLLPGEYLASVVFVTTAPKPRIVTVEVSLTVAMPEQWGALSGTVTDAHSGEPIGGVDVTLHSEWNGAPLDASATTDGDGAWTLIGPEGTWPIEFAKDGYVTVTDDATVEAGTTTRRRCGPPPERSARRPRRRPVHVRPHRGRDGDRHHHPHEPRRPCRPHVRGR